MEAIIGAVKDFFAFDTSDPKSFVGFLFKAFVVNVIWEIIF